MFKKHVIWKTGKICKHPKFSSTVHYFDLLTSVDLGFWQFLSFGCFKRTENKLINWKQTKRREPSRERKYPSRRSDS